MDPKALYRKFACEQGDLSYIHERTCVMGLLLQSSVQSREEERKKCGTKGRGSMNKSTDNDVRGLSTSNKSTAVPVLSLSTQMTTIANAQHPRTHHSELLKAYDGMAPKKRASPAPASQTKSALQRRWTQEERERLNNLYWEIGRPKRTDKESTEDLLKLYARRHRIIYRDRTEREVVEQVRHMLRYNKFREQGEKEYWKETTAKKRTHFRRNGND